MGITERSVEREMRVIAFLISAMRPLRTKDFDPLITAWRNEDRGKPYAARLFPLGRTTLKSALKAAVKDKLIKAEPLTIGKRTIIFYTPRQAAHVAYRAWAGKG